MRSPARITALIAVILQLVFISATPAQTGPAVPCADLAGQQLPNTTTAVAQAITSGSFTGKGDTNDTANFVCRDPNATGNRPEP